MKHTRPIQLAAAAALVVSATAWGQNSSAPSGGDSALRLLAAVGDGSVSKAADASGSVAADSAIMSQPVEIKHSQQTVSHFADAGTTNTASADQILKLATRAFDVILTLGVGYDSNPRLQTDADGEAVYWADLRFLLNPDSFGFDGRGVYYGFDIGSSIFSFSNSDRSLAGGRDNGELDAKVYTGIRGAKSDVRLDAGYRMNNGNLLDFSNLDRETRRADSDDFNMRLSASRKLDHSQLTGGLMWAQQNFNSDSALNDQSSFMGDGGWLFSPGFAPKTQVGAGFRMGRYDTDRNFEQTFYEPSFRFIHELSPKTSVTGRLGYTFIDYDGGEAISDNGLASYGAGLRWSPTSRTSIDLNAYRDYTPALAYVNQNYYRDGVGVTLSQLLPANWTMRGTMAYESADYFSTTAGASANRKDDYWRLGADLSHPLGISDWVRGQISAFCYYNSNDSSVNLANFDEMFTGMKVGLSY